MKQIDLTFKVNRVATFKNGSMLPTMSMKELMMVARGKGQLLYEVIEALAKYNGGTISEANDTLTFIEELKLHPVCNISEEKFALIEKALATATVEVKAAWANMISQLNMEGQ
ncbi:MAG: hypothetical protein E7075_00330 [Bacteroidales bacterium]|nr:hypothetical protein [Bacteroidales bacterium]